MINVPGTSPRLPYQHGFHAGNFADVMKHCVLISLLEHMRLKGSPFVYVDTHAGAGSYNLQAEAARLGEHKLGVSRLLSTSEELPASAAILSRLLTQSGGRYLGSPLIASQLCRQQDSLLLCEKAADQCALLRQNVGDDTRVTVQCADGYKALTRKELCSPQSRALVFMDPPYQMGSDSERATALVKHLRKHWRAARTAIWFPLSEDRGKTERLYSMMVQARVGEVLVAELAAPRGTVGSGMLLVQPPYGIEHELRELLPALGHLMGAPGLSVDREPIASVKWL